MSTNAPMLITDIKHCSRCKCHKPRTDFSDSAVAKDGKQPWCKQCTKLHREAKKRAQEFRVEQSP